MNTQQEEIKFTEIFEEQFINKLHQRFKTYLLSRKKGDNLQHIIENEIFIGTDKLNIEKILRNLNIILTNEEILNFLEHNCYQAGIPKLILNNDLVIKERTEMEVITGYCYFADNCFDNDYPYTTVEQQIDEISEMKLSSDFLNNVVGSFINNQVIRYKNEFGLN